MLPYQNTAQLYFDDFWQALKEQITSLEAQMKDQKEKVKSAAPDKKKLDELEKKVAAFKKGKEKFKLHSSSSFCCNPLR